MSIELWLITGIGAFSVLVASIGAFFQLRTSLRLRNWEDYLRLYLKQLEDAKIGSLEASKLQDDIEKLTAQFRKFRSRVTMQKWREENQSDNAEPDPQKDPQGWKAYQRARLGIAAVSVTRRPGDDISED